MVEDEGRQQASQTGDEDASQTLDQAASGGEGSSPAQAAPQIGDEEQQPEQTQTPAPANDVGVPEDVEHRTE